MCVCVCVQKTDWECVCIYEMVIRGYLYIYETRIFEIHCWKAAAAYVRLGEQRTIFDRKSILSSINQSPVSRETINGHTNDDRVCIAVAYRARRSKDIRVGDLL